MRATSKGFLPALLQVICEGEKVACLRADLLYTRPAMPVPIKPGETVTLDCTECSTEFEVTLEPKAKTDARSARNMPSKKVFCCPFCTADLTDQDEG